MDKFVKIGALSRIRSGLLQHVEAMFEVLEEIEGKERCRTRQFSFENWNRVRKIHRNLEDRFKALLILSILFHDLGKFVKWSGHAAIGAALLDDIQKQVNLAESDLGGALKFNAADYRLLRILVEHHEVLGNFFTGEQSLLGFLPIIDELKSDPKLIPPMFDVLLLLTIAEVGSLESRGLLYNVKFERYQTALTKVNEWVGPNPQAIDMSSATDYFFKETMDNDEFLARLAGLVYSFSPDIDLNDNWKRYQALIQQALDREGKSITEELRKNLSETRKLSYVLKWCNALAGELQARDGAEAVEGLQRIIRLLWIATKPVARFKVAAVEIAFPPTVDDDITKTLIEKLMSFPADLTDPLEGDWTLIKGLKMSAPKGNEKSEYLLTWTIT